MHLGFYELQNLREYIREYKRVFTSKMFLEPRFGYTLLYTVSSMNSWQVLYGWLHYLYLLLNTIAVNRKKIFYYKFISLSCFD